MTAKDKHTKKIRPETLLATATHSYREHGIVNPPVYHASTILFETLDSLLNNKQTYLYGRRGTPTSRAFETAIAQLEGGYACHATPSGLSAISCALLAFLKTGDHLLVVDSIYKPTRDFCNGMLAKLGIETTYFDPLIGTELKDEFRDNTALILLECPGSQTMEMLDVAAISSMAHDKGCLVAIDNTWGAGHFFKPLVNAGCDISIQAATKYIVGHSDAMLGTVTVTEPLWPQLHKAHGDMGLCVGPDDLYLGLRGLRTLDVRLKQHMANALEIANWLNGRPEVKQVLYPALPDDAGHALWSRDFTGACGLFSIVLDNPEPAAIAALVDHLELFGMGASWGGYESLVLAFDPKTYRTASTWPHPGLSLRFHIGLENTADLIDDLERGFDRFNKQL